MREEEINVADFKHDGGHCYWIVLVRGIVQGVGFRPFVFHLAKKLALSGGVRNAGSFVQIEIQGKESQLHQFVKELKNQCPRAARIDEVRVEIQEMPRDDFQDFEIYPSETQSDVIDIPMDGGICNSCLSEIRDPKDRRFQYALNSCTDCGPRWSILQSLPFDRERTSWREFPLCSECMSEYQDPRNRRFHAQGLSCPQCGPKIEVWKSPVESEGLPEKHFKNPLEFAVTALRNGGILAVKGVGGFQLWARACDREAVERLRSRKSRPKKPFALMVPHLNWARKLASLDPLSEKHLSSQARPILLVRKSQNIQKYVAENVAPDNFDLGLMLPASALQQILLDQLDEPVVATSGNLTNEPICYMDLEAMERLGRMADIFISHSLKVERPSDDSILRIIKGKAQVLRLARGYAPKVFELPPAIMRQEQKSAVAAGADQKVTVTLVKGNTFIMSQHLGDLGSQESLQNYEKVLSDLKRILRLPPAEVICDAHPDYYSTSLFESCAAKIQHHKAHFYAALMEAGLEEPALGIIWDGTGWGLDGTIWGGEFFYWPGWPQLGKAHLGGAQRCASLKLFDLIGGDRAVRDPRRVVWALTRGVQRPRILDSFFDLEEQRYWGAVRDFPKTSSMGRLFDGVEALIQLFENNYAAPSFEAEFAMKLEFRALRYWQKENTPMGSAPREKIHGIHDHSGCRPYSFSVGGDSRGISSWNWESTIEEILLDLKSQVSPDEIAARFHETVVHVALQMTLALKKEFDFSHVILSGGCFQNRILLERLNQELRKAGFQVHWPMEVPLHDGGVSLGQAYADFLYR